jgi:hypothetical protein
MLGRLKIDVDKCIEAYTNLAETVFGEKLHRLPADLMGRTQARFESTKLENAIKDMMSKRNVPEIELLNDGTKRGRHV